MNNPETNKEEVKKNKETLLLEGELKPGLNKIQNVENRSKSNEYEAELNKQHEHASRGHQRKPSK